MSATARTGDKWAAWVLRRQFGDDPERAEASARFLSPIRERVLDGAAIREGDTVLDAGCGSGLIAFGAVERVGESGRVIFSDVSEELLEHARSLAEEAGVRDRCEFVRASVDDLAGLADASVDAATTRSVLIYVDRARKRRAFGELFRVLRPGGRLSIFEPINSFGTPEPDERLFGFDVAEVQELAARVKAVYERATGELTLVDFDERDLLAFARDAGFARVELDYHAELTLDTPPRWLTGEWETLLHVAGNPCAPTLAEALDEALAPDERERLEAHLRAQLEAVRGSGHSAVAYLRAVKR